MGEGTKNSENWRARTKLVRGGTTRSEHCETSEALYLNSGYVYESAEEAEQSFNGEKDRFVYSRYANPTLAMFEERMCLLEGAKFCRGTSSGMAAVNAALMASVRTGDRAVASRALFSSCYHILNVILPRFGVEVEFVDGADLAQWEAALSKPAQCVFLESPSNPGLEITDMAAVSALAKKAGARVVVDNVFATPILQKPLDLGADVVCYSATKHIDGQGRCLGGAVLTNDEQWLEDEFVPYYRHTGPSLSPFNGWLLLKGLETLDLRVSQQCANAEAVAKFLESHSKITRVLYPGLESHPQHNLAMSQMAKGGTMVTFDVAGGKEGAFKLLNGLSTVDISNNLGDAKSLATHPGTTTHAKLSEDERQSLGIDGGTLRLSVGLEDIADIVEDLEKALS